MEAIAIMGGMFALLISAAILLSVFWIWMLIECIHNKEIKGAEKAFFLLLITFLHWIGGAIYCFSASRKNKLGCFPIMVIIAASFIGFFSLAGIIKLINENQNSNLIRAREIINEFVDKNIPFLSSDEEENDGNGFINNIKPTKQ